MEAEARQSGIEPLMERLRAVDPIAAARCGTNLRRIIRALEIFEATGIPMSDQEGKGPPPYDALEIGLTMPRQQLYQAIDDRVARTDRSRVGGRSALAARGRDPA